MTATPSSARIRTALIGYGLGGAVFHAPLIASTEGLQLEAIVTRDPVRQHEARAAYPEARIVATPNELWESETPPSLVAISTPNRTHVPLALEAIAHGAHVVVDKPLALTVSDARVLETAAREAPGGRLVIPFQNRRWDGDFLTVRALLAQGALGRVHRFESRFDRWREKPKGGWRETESTNDGGGLLYDIGSHLIDQALQLFGPVRDVYAEVDTRRDGVHADDDTFVALTHVSGVRSHLWATLLAAQPLARFRVLGSRASYVKWGLDGQEAALRRGARPTDGTWGEEDASQWGAIGSEGTTSPVRTIPGAYPSFYEGVVRAIHGEADPPVLVGEAIETLTLIECARESALRGVVVRVPTAH